MPLHDYTCAQCGKSERDQWSAPECCGVTMDIDWAFKLKHRPFKEFTTTHVNGQPITISSLSQLRRIEKQYGVNFPAYSGSMMPDQKGISQTTWEDANGHVHHD